MKPVLLLVPGMLNDAAVWDEVAAALAPVAEPRIAMPVQPTVAAMAEAAWALLRGVPAARPVLLAGFSLGGYVAIEMLARPARPLQAAALLCTSARPEPPEGRVQREKTIAAMRRDFDRVVDGLVPWNLHRADEARSARLAAMMRRVGAATAIAQLQAIMGRADHRAALAGLRLPLLVLGARHDRVLPPALAEEAAALVPGALCRIVEDAGHMLPMEQPDAVAAALRGLLHRIPTHAGDMP